jgi:chemotaxis protein CheD
MDNSHAVGLGEIKLSNNPDDVLVAYGLGSCVGISMYDPHVRVGALLHAVLPQRLNDSDARNPKFVDSGVASMLEKLEKMGAARNRLVVRMAGGATMLNLPGMKQSLNIGERNVAAARRVLASYNLELSAEDVGGNAGRTVRLHVVDGRTTVRAIGNPERDL